MSTGLVLWIDSCSNLYLFLIEDVWSGESGCVEGFTKECKGRRFAGGPEEGGTNAKHPPPSQAQFHFFAEANSELLGEGTMHFQ